MVDGLWGKKIGMTQVFNNENKVVPVTVIDVANWYVTQVKTMEIDGYNAVKLGCVKHKYAQQEFSAAWLSEPRKYFSAFKEVPSKNAVDGIAVGQPADATVFTQGDAVDVFGLTKGAGFQGVVKRHGFAGGRGSHGQVRFGRWPGSLGNMHTRGRVFKGKRLPGHMGNAQRVMKNLEIVKVEPEARVVLVKGSVPGKSGSLVFVRKSS